MLLLKITSEKMPPKEELIFFERDHLTVILDVLLAIVIAAGLLVIIYVLK